MGVSFFASMNTVGSGIGHPGCRTAGGLKERCASGSLWASLYELHRDRTPALVRFEVPRFTAAGADKSSAHCCSAGI
jgi:hypothetical protein